MAKTLVVGGLRYYVHPQRLGFIASLLPDSANVVDNYPVNECSVQPAAVVSAEEAISVTAVREILDRFATVDDVYHKDFGEHVVVQAVTSASKVLDASENVSRLTASNAFQGVSTVAELSHGLPLPSGPYFICGRAIHQAWRLYVDDLEAFSVTIVPHSVQDPSRFSVLDSMSEDGLWRHVAVPSRLYHKVTHDRPLAGLRLNVKDIFDIAGIKTTLSSRAYGELYPARTEHSDFVKKLLSFGAIIVGKTQITSFASSDEPTDQWIDFHCPRNPRGDRYQSPSGSSTGAAASLAGYGWLDAAIGADTGGSIRAPATCNGLYSLRPSFNTTSMKGIAANCRAFDVVGFFGRELSKLHHVVKTTLDLRDSTQYPRKIIYPTDFFPHSNPAHQQMVDELISVLESFLGVQRTTINIAERWAQCPPIQAQGKSLKEYTAKSAFWPMCYDYYHLYDDFRQDYKQKFGAEPYQGPIVKFRWGVGASVTEADFRKGMEELRVFREWFNENIMTSTNELLSDAIMIMPYGSANPKYRDAPNEAPSTSATIGEKFMSPILQMPQLVLPFAQMPYKSVVTGNQEYRPIATTLMGAKGSDLLLLNLAYEALQSVKWPTVIQTGSLMFDVGDNLRNVADPQTGDIMPHSSNFDKAVEVTVRIGRSRDEHACT